MHTQTAGQKLTAELRKEFSIGTRTRSRRGGMNLRDRMIDAIKDATTYPGIYDGERHAAYSAAWTPVFYAWDKHIATGRVDPLLTAHLKLLSPWRLSAFFGEMLDAGYTNMGEAERWFQAKARELDALAA